MTTFHIRTWGCQMNYADTEKMQYALEKKGLKPVVRVEEADVIILNTCSVRQRAEDKVFGFGRKAVELKVKKPHLKIILTGCMANRYNRHCGDIQYGVLGTPDTKYSRNLRRKMPWVDHFIEIGDLDNLISDVVGSNETVDKDDTDRVKASRYLSAPQRNFSKIIANVPISSGCDNFCSYCIVPFTRGREIHRPYKEIYMQVEQLVKKGCKKITLLGQNVNSWQVDENRTLLTFTDLVHALGEIPGDFWLTYLTSHPKDFPHELADEFISNSKLCRYINLPAQSGSNEILKKMHRSYTREEYLDKVGYLKEVAPDVRISTDIIVGFPGETEGDFKDTMDLLDKATVGMVYVAEYSPRPGAASSLMEDTVPAEVKADRRRAVEDFVRNKLEKANSARVGNIEKVLVITETKGETNDCQDVRFDGISQQHIGEFVKAELTGSSASGFMGRIIV